MNRLVPIGEASKILGISISTLRRWEKEGRLIPEHTASGHRRYDLSKIKPELFHTDKDNRRTIAYARVSSHDQKADLERQKQVLELYCASQGWRFEVISDLGSGMNYHKKSLSLTTREWTCPSCQTHHDRDLNAAINLANYAVSSTVSACGGEGSGFVVRKNSKVKPAPMKQEINTKTTYG